MTSVRRVGVALPALLALFLVAISLAIAPAVPRVMAGTNGAATDDYYTAFEDTPLTVAAPGVLGNDYPSDSCTIAEHTDTFELRGSIGSGPALNGSFTYTPAKDFNGLSRFVYGMGQFDGFNCPTGQADLGEVFITVVAVNDPPRVVLGPDCKATITVEQDSSQFTARHCVEMQNFGPADESDQAFNAWLVSTNQPELFAGKPTVARIDGRFGRLRFTPAEGASGTATISIRGRDSGGTQNKGKNTSAAVKVKVVITAQPTPEPTLEPTPQPTAEPTPTATIDPTDAPTSAPTDEATEAPASSPEPSGSPSPSSSSSPSGIVLLLGGLLVLLVAGFAAAILYPRWRAARP